MVPCQSNKVVGKTPVLRKAWLDLDSRLIPLEAVVEKRERIPSLSRPGSFLKRLEVKFHSQEINGRKWGHPCLVFIPERRAAFAKKNETRVVIVGQRSWDGLATGPWRDSFEGNYGEPIAALTGYPTMILPVPGEYDGTHGREISIGFLRDRRRKTGKLEDHSYMRLAVPYLRALDVMAKVLEVPKESIRAVIGGHSKRATSAFTAAAIDPERIAGVVYMGNESTWTGYYGKEPWRHIAPFESRKWVKAKVLYMGGTNEDGYAMFNINKIQERMEGAWKITMIPNYRHASMSEKHFLNWRAWVSHVFDGRPWAKIGNVTWGKKKKGFLWGGRDYGAGTIFKVRIHTDAKIIQVKIWYVYNDDGPYWRDLFWYPEFMVRTGEGEYAGFVKGRFPDACLVEVKETALGHTSYVTSLPVNLSGMAPATRRSFGSRSRNWSPVK